VVVVPVSSICVLCIVCLQVNTEEKVLTRIACSNVMQKVITRWRQEHEDWEALAAFALSKNTGRRFKKKPLGDLNSTLDVSIDRETGVSHADMSEKTTVRLSDSIQDDDIVGGSVSLNNESWQTTSIKPGADKPSKSKHELDVSRSEQQATERSQMQQHSDGSCHSVAHRDVVVKQVSLDELSDEELFLPPPDDDISESVEVAVQNASMKAADGFFVVSSDRESSDSETPVSTAVIQTAASSSDTDDGDDDSTSTTTGLRNSVKSSTMFAKSLSHCHPSGAVKTAREDKKWKRNGSVQQNQQFTASAKKHFDDRNAGKRFSDKRFTKSQGTRQMKKNEKSSYGNAKVNTKYVSVTCISSS